MLNLTNPILPNKLLWYLAFWSVEVLLLHVSTAKIVDANK